MLKEALPIQKETKESACEENWSLLHVCVKHIDLSCAFRRWQFQIIGDCLCVYKLTLCFLRRSVQFGKLVLQKAMLKTNSYWQWHSVLYLELYVTNAHWKIINSFSGKTCKSMKAHTGSIWYMTGGRVSCEQIPSTAFNGWQYARAMNKIQQLRSRNYKKI